jgi:CHAD domain-containing protein
MRRRISAATGLRKIFVRVLEHLTSNIAATLRGDPEGIHQMRIALRALRAALELFKPHLDPIITRYFDTELKELGRLFGTARDWDVFCLETLPAAIADLRPEALSHVRHAAETERRLAHEAILDTVYSRHFSALLMSLAAWIADVAAKSRPLRDQRLTALAPSLLDRIAAMVRKRDRRSGTLSGETRHRLRKALDNLCDDVSFLTPLFPRRPLERYLGRCESLQAILGFANDADVAKRLVLSLRGDRPADALLRWIKRRNRTSLRCLAVALDDFRAAPAFWR